MLRRSLLLGAAVLPTLAITDMVLPLLSGGGALGQNKPGQEKQEQGKQGQDGAPEPARPFEADTVRTMARDLAAKPFQPPDRKLPANLDTLGYDDYRNIRFEPARAVWHGRGLPFEMQLFHRGFIFKDRVDIYLVDGGAYQHVRYDPAMFRFDNGVKTAGATRDIGFSGFRIHSRLNSPDRLDEVVAFQGASYFRAVGKGQGYGTSARGLALKTGEAEGEEFPAFKAFFVEQPKAGIDSLVVHALLDSESAAAALRLTIRPGDNTVTTVELTLYPRVDLARAGIGTLTSMFLFGPNDRDGFDDFRPAVHDSHGLEIATGRGVRLWRPLTNPSRLGMSVFEDINPQGFGLMQRQRSFFDYQDLEARYEKRPSVWIEPIGDWGEGAVHLVEIPVREEIHDNIVAFWRPKQPLRKGSEYRYTYRIHWAWDSPLKAPLARVAATRSGGTKTRRLFVVDFAKGEAANAGTPLRAEVTASAGVVAPPVVEPNPETGGTRLAFRLEPRDAAEVELRARLLQGDQAVSESWICRWTT